MKTFSAKKEEVERKWWLVDAEGLVLGRLATRITDILRGKNKPIFTPHVDTGDFVIVVNAEKIRLTGRKLDEKLYWRHTGHPGGIKSMTAREMLEKKPEEVLRLAVKRMMRNSSLNRQVIGKLKIYAGPDHPHQAQQPEKLEIQT